MRRFVLPVAVATLAVFAALCAEGAVEVFTKTPTKLCDAQGKVIEEVTAGYPFEADKAQGKWVYGFIKRKGGGRRGFIALDDLYMTDDNRRALSIPITTGKSAEPVLLRLKAKEGELQRYELSMSMHTQKTTRVGRDTHSEDDLLRVTCGLRFECKNEKDGVYTMEARCDRFDLSGDMKSDKLRVQMKADTNQVTVYVNGERKYSGTWEGLPGGSAPDLSRLLKTTATVKMDERGRFAGGQDLSSLFNPEAEEQRSGTTKALHGGFQFPEGEVRGGDTWAQKIEAEVENPIDEQRSLAMSGTAGFTVLERLTYMERPCVKIRVEGRFTMASPEPGTQAVQSLAGTHIVDERSGRELLSTVVSTLTVTESQPGTSTTCTYTEWSELRYAGNKPR